MAAKRPGGRVGGPLRRPCVVRVLGISSKTIGIDAQGQPTVFDAATAYVKSGKPDGSVIDSDGTEKVMPVVLNEGKPAPQASFWQKLGEAWKLFAAEAKGAVKKVEKEL